MRPPTFRRTLFALGVIALGALAYVGAVLLSGSASAGKPPPSLNVPGAAFQGGNSGCGAVYPDGGFGFSCSAAFAPVVPPDGKRIVSVTAWYDTSQDPNPPNAQPEVDLLAATDAGVPTTMAALHPANLCTAPCSVSTTTITAPAVNNASLHYWVAITGNFQLNQGEMKILRVQIQYK